MENGWEDARGERQLCGRRQEALLPAGWVRGGLDSEGGSSDRGPGRRLRAVRLEVKGHESACVVNLYPAVRPGRPVV